MKKLLFGLGTICFLVGCLNNASGTNKEIDQNDEKVQENDLKVIAYYTGSTGKVDDETAGQLDQIIYSFLHLKGNELHVEKEKDSASIAYLISLKEVNPDLKVLISLGGWGGCETCSDVFSTQKGRSEFAKSVKEILVDYDADGIDLDWEYPVVPGYPGHPHKPADRENFTYLVEELRQELGEEYEISFAAGGFDSFLEKAIEWDKVMPLLDGVNLMSYDLVNGGSAGTGHHTSLFSTPEQVLSADNAIRFLDSIGVPKEKIVLGSAFYARVWEEVDNVSSGLHQPGKFKESVLFKDLGAYQEEHKGFSRYWDTVAQAPYLYNPEKGLFVTYDDELSIARKTEYAIEKGLRGIMFWQLSGDRPEDGLIDVIDEVKEQM